MSKPTLVRFGPTGACCATRWSTPRLNDLDTAAAGWLPRVREWYGLWGFPERRGIM
jgi:hypothetical protein